MTLVAVPGPGLYFPGDLFPFLPSGFGQALDAAGEKLAMIGHVFWDGRPGSAKTFSAAGGASISVRTGAVTFANGTTSIDVGIQDVATATGPPVVPDEAFDVQSAALVGGGGAFVASTYTTISMTGGSGSKSIAHAQLIAVVIDMTARGGADSVVFNSNGGIPNSLFGRPITMVKLAGAWSIQGGNPNVLLTSDDGTLGMLDGWSFPFSANPAESFADATNPDERGIIFQVPWDCSVDAIWHATNGNAAGSDFTLKLWSDPLGTPVDITPGGAGLPQLGEQYPANASRPSVIPFASVVNLTRNTNYGVTALATGASNISMLTMTLGNEAHRALYMGGTTVAKITRNNSTGAFAAESPAITRPWIGVRVSHQHDGAGAGGGGGLNVLGGIGGVIG